MASLTKDADRLVNLQDFYSSDTPHPQFGGAALDLGAAPRPASVVENVVVPDPPGRMGVNVQQLPAQNGAVQINGASFAPGAQLGQGAFGTVTRYPQQGGPGSVAVKTGKGVEQEARFQTAAGPHPNIARCLGLTNAPGSSALVMEELGPDLEKVQNALQRRWKSGEISHEKFIGTMQYLMHGVMTGVTRLGDQGIVHRDLKPQNVLLDPQTLQPKIGDFGLARDLDGLPKNAAGTIGYRAPEQDRGAPGERSDVFSAGAMLLRCDARANQDRLPEPNALSTAQAQALSGVGEHHKLIKQLMQEDPTQRPSAQYALGAPYLRDRLLDDEGARAVLNRVPDAPSMDWRGRPIPPPAHQAQMTGVLQELTALYGGRY